MKTRLPRLAALGACLVAALGLAACGEKDDGAGTAPQRESLTLVLDYFPNADHAGIYAAEAIGAFDSVGLDVQIESPADPAAPLKLLAGGRADLAISYEPEVLLARDRGADIVSVGALVQKPLTSIISLPKAKIRGPADLEGKTVGTAGIPYQSAYLDAILEEAGVPPDEVKEVDVGFNLTAAMISGRVDATLGSFWNYEGTDLEQRDRDPRIIRMERVGIPPYDELVIAATEETTRDRGSVIRRFWQALRRGTEALREDPDVGVDALLEANPDLERKLQEAVVEKTLPVFFPDDEDRPFGYQDFEEWRAYSDWMRERGLLMRPADPTALTNEFLPGAPIGEETPGLD